MYRIMVVGFCASLAFAGLATAAQIDYTATDTVTLPDQWQSTYGLTADYLLDEGFYLNGTPSFTRNYRTDPGHNPAYVDRFLEGGSGGGGGGGGNGTGGIGAEGDYFYELRLNDGKKFDFTTLFYNPNYDVGNAFLSTDIAIEVRLIGHNDTDDPWHAITVGQIEKGIWLTWDATIYDDDPLRNIILDIKFVNGDGSQTAAAFFLSNLQDVGNAPAIPEPATVSLVLFGLAGIFARRARK